MTTEMQAARAAVGELEERRAALADVVTALRAERERLDADRLMLEQQAFGRGDALAEQKLEGVMTQLQGNAARLRGVSAERVAVAEALAAACAGLRALLRGEQEAEAKSLTAEIAELKVRLDALTARRAPLLMAAVESDRLAPLIAQAEAEAVGAIRDELGRALDGKPPAAPPGPSYIPAGPAEPRAVAVLPVELAAAIRDGEHIDRADGATITRHVTTRREPASAPPALRRERP